MSTPKSRREILSEEIVEDVRSAIREELGGAERPLTEEDCAAIEAEKMTHTTHILGALSTGEMQSEGALLAHISNARFEASRLIRQRPSKPADAATGQTGKRT